MKYFSAAFTLLFLLSAQAQAFEINTMTPEERAIFRQEVRSYLLESPEVLMEAIAVLEQRQATANAVSDVELIANNTAALFTDAGSFEGGNPEGDIVMVEFLDYRCGFCKRAHPEVVELIRADGNIKLIVKEFPILGEQSVLASRFAISVLQNADADTYEIVHDELMAFRGDITVQSLERLANELNLETATIMGAMQSDNVSNVIAENRALAVRLQINGTPAFIMGNQLMRGYVPLDGMQKIVADLRLASR
ncbi:MAG: DsbA family protein [Paracoccaceae bacterium]